jgi:hypothetical protein
MSNPKQPAWQANLADPVYAAMMGVTQAVAWFAVHGMNHGFPASRTEARDAALVASFQLALPLAFCFLFRLVLARRQGR